jgi:hypothetical protein
MTNITYGKKQTPAANKARVARDIENYVNTTHYITLSLCAGRMVETEGRGRCWIPGDDIIYTEAYQSFIRSLSKRLAGRADWATNRRLLKAVGVIGGDKSLNMNDHLHIQIEKPASVSENDFRAAVHRVAAGNMWVKQGPYAVDIRSVEDEQEASRATHYTVNHGVDRLCV